MSHINSFGIRDLRSFGSERNLIPLKTVNVLVGRNSCGKSTFLRAFPLLRQSIEANTRSPILWFGRFADFGDFHTALRQDANSISFDFDTSLDFASDDWEDADVFTVETETSTALPLRPKIKSNLEFHADISLTLKKGTNELVENTLDLRIRNISVQMIYSGVDVSSFVLKCHETGTSESFSIKRVSINGALIPLRVVGWRSMTMNDEKLLLAYDRLRHDGLIRLATYLKQFHHPSKKQANIRQELLKLPLSHSDTLYENLSILFQQDKVFIRNLKKHETEILATVFLYLTAINTTRFLRVADALFKDYFSGVRYSGPLRAAGERFYRYQDLEIDEVDHTGANLPMVINSMSEENQKSLGTWISEQFGFELRLFKQGLHYELLIKESLDKEFHNVSDMGFGYSQILPVIVSIWMELVPKKIRRKAPHTIKRSIWPRILVLEQPELHLHPALQYKFGTAIAKVASLATKNNNFLFVIETHSKHLIDALGQSIRDNEISEEKVNIVLFDKNENGMTETNLAGFDEDGYLVDWPIGFLSVQP